MLCCAVLCCAAQLDGRGKATRVRYALDEALLARAEQEGYRRGVSLEFRETTVSISLSPYPSIYLGRQRDASEPAAGVSGARHARAWSRMDPRRAACQMQLQPGMLMVAAWLHGLPGARPNRP